MRRGTDESAIESMAEAADPIVINLKPETHHNEKKKENQKELSSREKVDDILLYGASFSDINAGFTSQSYNGRRYD